ncbi:MAG: SAF domain-containing protein, partial [Anaerolineales bacterium]
WAEMVARTRELELALGSTDKFVADNERDTVIVQRRCLRAGRDIKAGEEISREMLDVLRPATPGAIQPLEIESVIGTRALVDIPSGKELRWTELAE